MQSMSRPSRFRTGATGFGEEGLAGSGGAVQFAFVEPLESEHLSKNIKYQSSECQSLFGRMFSISLYPI